MARGRSQAEPTPLLRPSTRRARNALGVAAMSNSRPSTTQRGVVDRPHNAVATLDGVDVDVAGEPVGLPAKRRDSAIAWSGWPGLSGGRGGRLGLVGVAGCRVGF